MTPCVVIPAFNESKHIGHLVRTLCSDNLPVIVIDDGSTDATSLIARESGALVFRNPENQGKGLALRKGLFLAEEIGFDAYILMDGDGQHDPADLPRFVEAAGAGADIIFGNRMNSPRKMPMIRIWSNRFLSWFISKVCGQHIPDSQCGFLMMTSTAFRTMNLATSHFEINSEIVIQACRARLKTAFIPIRCLYGSESSRISPVKDTLRFFCFALHLLRDYRIERSKKKATGWI